MQNPRDRKKRDGRRDDPASRREAAALDLRRRVRGVLGKLKVLDLFEKMPKDQRDQFYGLCWPDPVLVFDASFPSAEAFGGTYAEIRRTVREGFARATIVLNGFNLAVRDFGAIVAALAQSARYTLDHFDSPFYKGPAVPAAFRTFLQRAVPVLEFAAREEVKQAAFLALHQEVIVPLVSRSKLDARLLHGKLAIQQTPRGAKLVMTLYSEKPEMKYVRLRGGTDGGGGSRPMHRVGTPNNWHGIDWASWSSESLKRHWQEELGIGEGEAWPVFVQSHALGQLRKRLDVYAYADWAEHWMVQSLKEPKIVSRLPGGELLVAFEVMEKRLGYLVVSARDGLVAVRTFLFLTMAQTPEGKMLEKKLNLTRDELSYLRLHELSRFTHTDLKDDPDLRKLLNECGCGQLFELAEEEHVLMPEAISPFAEELKQYVGMAA